MPFHCFGFLHLSINATQLKELLWSEVYLIEVEGSLNRQIKVIHYYVHHSAYKNTLEM